MKNLNRKVNNFGFNKVNNLNNFFLNKLTTNDILKFVLIVEYKKFVNKFIISELIFYQKFKARLKS